MKQVEWGDTAFVLFTTQYNNDGVWENIDPSSMYAVSESFLDKPVFIENLSYLKRSTGIYSVKFYADKTKYQPKTNYFVTLYWEYNGVKKCERAPISIKADVRR